ncbi:hypothetical protein BGI37_10625 [Snodgrassella alvi]|nr:hypothetical protein BGI37_10625 [Snodgrassella alvi]
MNSSSYLLHSSCPSCGAEIGIHSATAVTAVCGYCHSVLLINQNKLVQSGRHSAVLNDLSPLQIGTTGVWQDKPFTLIGRMQVNYDAGSWNEWHALMHDGSSAWLSEANDRFVFTRLQPALPDLRALPEFNSLKIGNTFFKYKERRYAVADIRNIQRGQYAAEGELPIPLPRSETARVADCRNGASFITLDYSDGEAQPQVFAGKGIALKSLRLQNTRTPEQIRTRAGHVKGSTKRGKCPNCGGEIRWVSGVADYVVCQYCRSQQDMGEETAQLHATSEMRQQQESLLTIKIGSRARIGNESWWVLGAMVLYEVPVNKVMQDVPLYIQVAEHEETEAETLGWTEYLLYSPKKGFLWLLELENNQWALASTLDDWPALNRPLEPIDFRKDEIPFLYDYAAQVLYAAGAFYWQVAPGDSMYYVDYGCEQRKLSTTLTRNEQSWSVVSSIPASLVAAWFQGNKNISIKAKPLPADKAVKIVREHQSIKAKDFTIGNIRKWRLQTVMKPDIDARTANFWMALFIVLNFPIFFMIFIGGLANNNFCITPLILHFITYALLVKIPYRKWGIFEPTDNTKKYNLYLAALIVIIFTWGNYAAFNNQSNSVNSSHGGYYGSGGRWHK